MGDERHVYNPRCTIAIGVIGIVGIYGHFRRMVFEASADEADAELTNLRLQHRP